MDSFAYKLFFLLHISSIVVAFAPVVVALLPGVDIRPAYRGIARTVYMAALILAGLFGLILVMLSDEVWEFSQTWVSLALLVWIAMNGVFHAFVLSGKGLPGAEGRRGRGARREGGGTAVAVNYDTGEAVMTVLFVIMLWLMIWKPGL